MLSLHPTYVHKQDCHKYPGFLIVVFCLYYEWFSTSNIPAYSVSPHTASHELFPHGKQLLPPHFLVLLKRIPSPSNRTIYCLRVGSDGLRVSDQLHNDGVLASVSLTVVVTVLLQFDVEGLADDVFTARGLRAARQDGDSLGVRSQDTKSNHERQ